METESCLGLTLKWPASACRNQAAEVKDERGEEGVEGSCTRQGVAREPVAAAGPGQVGGTASTAQLPHLL